MKMLIGLGGSGMLLGGLYAGGALTRGEVYPKPFAQVYSELAAMPVPTGLVQALSGTDATAVRIQRAPEAIGWHFLVQGEEVSVFTATLSREGAWRTRVTVDFAPGTQISPHLDRMTATALVRSMAEIAMSEQVDARLENRPLDESAALDRMARHAINNPDQVRAYGESLKAIYVDIGNEMQRNASAGAAHQPDPKKMMADATRPSVTLQAN